MHRNEIGDCTSKNQLTTEPSTKVKIPLATLAIALSHQGSRATDYHVSSTGSDTTGNGTTSTPWASVAHASSQVAAGSHTINIAAGTYTETARIVLRPGVNLEGAGKATTIIRNNYTSRELISLDNRDDGVADGTIVDGNQTLSDFSIIGINHANRTLQYGMWIRGRDAVTVSNVDFSDMGQGGIRVIPYTTVGGAEPSAYLENIKVHDCVFTNTAGDGYGNIIMGGLRGAEFSNIIIRESLGLGVKDQIDGWLRGVKLDNIEFDMLHTGRDAVRDTADDWPCIEWRHHFDDCQISNCSFNHWSSISAGDQGSGTRSIVFSNNRFIYSGTHVKLMIGNHGCSDLEFSNNYFGELPAIAGTFALASWPFHGEIDNLYFHHNVFEGDGSGDAGAIYINPNDIRSGFSGDDGNIDNIQIHNNSFRNLGTSILIQPKNSHSATNIAISNNICSDEMGFAEIGAVFGLKTSQGACDTATITHNLFYNIASNKSVSTQDASNVTLSDSIFEDPQFSRSGDKPSPFFELVAGRPANDAGPDVRLTVADGLPDIGAYEFVSSGSGTDTDGDGRSDAQEAIDGTDPNDPTSFLAAVEYDPGAAKASVTLTWRSVPGKVYLLQYSPDLITWTDHVTVPASASATTTHSGASPIPGTERLFWRVRIAP